MSLRLLSEEPLHVAEELRGAPLASPLRRAVAFMLDLAVVAVPSVAVAVAAAGASLAVAQPRVFDALRTLILGGRSATPAAQHQAMRTLAPLLVKVEAEGLPREVEEAVAAGDLDRAAGELEKLNLTIVIGPSEHMRPALAPGTVRFPLERLIPEAVRGLALYGVAALYFAAFTRGRRGATPGKRLLGIRVARLDGERLSWYESLERFVGYLHIPGTLGVGLADLWREPNRRLAHDRVANTAVLRVSRRSTAGRKSA